MKFMRLLLVAVCVLMFSSLVIATPETHQVGPYKISFDLKPPLQHQIQVKDTISTSSYQIYSMNINTNNTTVAGISVTEYKNQTDATLSTTKEISGLTMARRGFNVSMADIKIDGKSGFVSIATPVTPQGAAPSNLRIYSGYYWLDSQDCACGPLAVGKTTIGVSSASGNMTQSILDSLHVVKTG